MELRISPKEAISEWKLAAKTGMGRTPVREALKKLKNEGIITSYDKRGYFLNIPTIKEIKDLYEIRIILEGAAARIAAEKIDLNQLKYFEKQILLYKKKFDDYKGNKTSNKDYSFVDLGRKFHFFIMESTENKKLKELIENIYDYLNISRIFSYNRRREEAIDEHIKILNALKDRKGEESQKYMEEHLKNAFGVLVKVL